MSSNLKIKLKSVKWRLTVSETAQEAEIQSSKSSMAE